MLPAVRRFSVRHAAGHGDGIRCAHPVNVHFRKRAVAPTSCIGSLLTHRRLAPGSSSIGGDRHLYAHFDSAAPVGFRISSGLHPHRLHLYAFRRSWSREDRMAGRRRLVADFTALLAAVISRSRAARRHRCAGVMCDSTYVCCTAPIVRHRASSSVASKSITTGQHLRLNGGGPQASTSSSTVDSAGSRRPHAMPPVRRAR